MHGDIQTVDSFYRPKAIRIFSLTFLTPSTTLSRRTVLLVDRLSASTVDNLRQLPQSSLLLSHNTIREWQELSFDTWSRVSLVYRSNMSPIYNFPWCGSFAQSYNELLGENLSRRDDICDL